VTVRNFLAFFGFLAALSASALAWELFTLGNGDPLDGFKVGRVTSEQGSKRYAVTYLYHHANSSNRVVSAWVGSGTPPAVGSTERPHGAPALTWTGKPEELNLTWSQGHLEVSADRVEVQTDKMYDCYFSGDAVRRLCVDPKAANIVAVQQR
jgi:hypothetical protein